MSAPPLELAGVCLRRGGRDVLEDVDLTVEARDYLALLGPNGSGKTTLLLVALGLLAPERGRVRVFGRPPHAARGLVGYVPQRPGFDLDFPIRVRDVVLQGRLSQRGFLRRYTRDDRDAVARQLARLEIGDLAERPVGELSGGQLQRVLIARALVSDPQLLLLDEPAASLDERIGTGLFDLLEELSQQCAVVIVSHDIGAISRSVRRVACLNRKLFMHESGRLTEDVLEAAYGCPVDLVAHGHPHRVFAPHSGGEGT